MPDRRLRLNEAIKQGKIKDEKTLAAFVMIEELRDELEERLKELKEQELSTNKILEHVKSLKGKDGEDGKTPTQSELLSLIRPLIPDIGTMIEQRMPSKEEILRLIKPFIPKVKDGKTPSIEEVKAIIETLLPDFEEIKNELLSKIPPIEDIENRLPILGERIRDSLELLQGEERLKREAIDGLDDYEEVSRLARIPKEGGGGSTARNFYQLFDTPETYSGEGGKFVVVKGDETGLEFTDVTPGDANWTPQGVTNQNVGGIHSGDDLGTSPVSIEDTLLQIFYPPIAPSIVLFASEPGGLRETGDIDDLTAVEFEAETTKGTNNITLVEFLRNGGTIYTVPAPNPNGGTEVNPTPETITTNVQYRARVGDGILPNVLSNIINYTFAFAYLYGVGEPGLTPTQVGALTKDVRNNTPSLSVEFAPTDEVAYFAYPSAYPALTSIKDQNNFETISDWTVTTGNITNDFGETTEYRIYEFNNRFTSAGFSWTFIQ